MFIHADDPLWVLEMRKKKLGRDKVESVEKLETATTRRMFGYWFNVGLRPISIDRVSFSALSL